jgi:hypothetical protein
MINLIDRIMQTLEDPSDGVALDEALLNAAFLFEKARKLPACGWPEEVVRTDTISVDILRLKRAVVEFVEREGFGTWTLSKCQDPSLKPVFIQVMRRHLQGDAGELFQAMLALSDLGENVFPDKHSMSVLDEAGNRELAREYLRQWDLSS